MRNAVLQSEMKTEQAVLQHYTEFPGTVPERWTASL